MIILDLQAIRDVSPAVEKNPEHPVLGGVHVQDFGEKRRYVATNGILLLMVETKKPKDDGLKEGLILRQEKMPTNRLTKNFSRTFKILDDGKRKSLVSMDFDDFCAFTVINERYPDVDKVFPKGELEPINYYMTVNPKYLVVLQKFLNETPLNCPYQMKGKFDSSDPYLFKQDGTGKKALLMGMRK